MCACSGQRTSVLPQPDAASQAQPQTHHRDKAKLTIRIRVPHHRRGHRGSRYISPATLGAKLTLIGTESIAKSVALTPGLNSVKLSLEPGTYKATVATYDAAPVGGIIPGTAKVLSSASNLPLTVAAGEANLASFTLDGVIASLALALPSANIGTLASKPLAVTAKDAAGYIILGTYENAVLVTDTDSSGHTTIATSGSDHPPAGELLSSSDAATLSYDGSSANFSAAIRASAAGASAANATFVPSPVLSSLSATTVLDGTSVTETLTGNFVTGATSIVVPDGSGISVLDVSAATANHITATFFIDPHVAAAGGVPVTVQTSAGANSASQTLTISTTGVDIVTKNSDTIQVTVPGVCTDATHTADGLSGELRYAMCTAQAGDTIVFDTTAMCGANGVTGNCTIAIGAPLPPIQQNQTIDGGLLTVGTPRVVIDGASKYRAFWAESGTVGFNNLQIQNVLAQGGAGGNAANGGGGGAGLGGALFVNRATVDVTNDYFVNCAAVGGAGGGIIVDLGGGGGGGGMGGAGGSMLRYPAEMNPQDLLGAGGGGVLGTGGNTTDGMAGNGGYGGGGGGGQQVTGPEVSATPGKGGTVYPNPSSSPSVTPTGGPGGAGKFGGGGGGGGPSTASGSAGNGGAGGFGGGGGAAGGYASSGTTTAYGGNGGAGGGGGGSLAEAGGSGGALATISGGSGGGGGSTVSQPGGGGAAAGPAIFVNTGTLTTSGSVSTACISATAGAAGGTGATAGGTDTTPVYNNGGTVNGDTNTGGYSNALPSVASPDARRLHRRHRQPK